MTNSNKGSSPTPWTAPRSFRCSEIESGTHLACLRKCEPKEANGRKSRVVKGSLVWIVLVNSREEMVRRTSNARKKVVDVGRMRVLGTNGKMLHLAMEHIIGNIPRMVQYWARQEALIRAVGEIRSVVQVSLGGYKYFAWDSRWSEISVTNKPLDLYGCYFAETCSDVDSST